MLEILHQLLPQLSHTEKIEMLTHLKEAIAEELIADYENNHPSSCPRCGCSHFVKKGQGRLKEQRWLCGGCARTFLVRPKDCWQTQSLVEECGWTLQPVW